MQEYKFSHKFVRMAPRKVRLLTNLVKTLSPAEALDQLRFYRKSAATPVFELLKSAIASCKNDHQLDINDIAIKSFTCDGGPTLKRRHFKSRGRTNLIHKRTSHINLVLASMPKKNVNKSAVKTKSIKKSIASKDNTNKIPKSIKKIKE